MNTKIKLFSVGMIALLGLVLGANFASAQTATITTCTSATLNGILDTTGGSATTVWFEWGTTPSYGNSTNPQGPYYSAPQNFSQAITGLNPSTTYYYDAILSNAAGARPSVNALSFTTPSCATQNNQSAPTVTTNSASSVAQNSATLNGYVTPNGSNTNVWFEWGTSQSFGNTTPSANYGTGATSFSNSIFNLNANTTYYYRAAAQGSQGTVYGSTLSFTTSGQTQTYSQPYVSTNSASSVSQNSATLNGYVAANGTNVSGWFEWGTSYALGNTTSYNSYGSGSTIFNSGIYNLSPNTTYYYRAAAQSSYGTTYGSVLSFTTTGQASNGYIVAGSAPTVTTLLATELTGTTAKLNGLVFASSNLSSNAWFEWGTTASLGNKTQSVNVGAVSPIKHSDFITGLTLGQTYYYRIAAQNSYGTSYGAVNTFVSDVSTYVPVVTKTPVVLKPTSTVITQSGNTQSLVMLTLDGGVDAIGGGEKRTYHVSWKNVSGQSLKNVVLQVAFPQTMTIDSATKGSFSKLDNSVIINLKTLAPSETGDAFIFATTDRGLKSGQSLVVTANMVYTGANGVQGDAIAYVTHTAEAATNALGASVFGAGEFLPTTLFEWILLIIMVLALILLGNHLYGRFSGPTQH